MNKNRENIKMRNGSVSALAAMLFATMGSFGSEISAETAESTAGAFLQRSAMARRILPDRTVAGSGRWGSLWIVNLSPSGHIVVSGTDKCAPIQQFSPDDFTEPAEDTPRLDVLTAASERCAEAEADPDLEVSSEWASYATSTSSSTRRSKAGAANATDCNPYVAPFLDASWHQGSPYSDFSPLTVVCGCMATAAGQEHRYWRWPYFIPKFRTITHGLRGNVNQTIRYNGFVPFNYDLIYGSYDGGDTPPKTGNDSHGNNAKRARYEAAYLTHWMQSMVKMSFGPGASGGTQKLCSEANEIYFEKGDVLNKYRNGYDTLWTAITNDLEFGSPINVNTPGHQMVIDGYGVEVSDGVQKDWININYGWGGGITWVDMRTEYDSCSLADFQIGYRPRKMVQIEPIAKKATGSVNLICHLPPCYTNKVGAIRAEICTVSDNVESSATYCGVVPIAQSNTETVFTLPVDIRSYSNDTNLRFYAYPVMSDGSEVVMSDPVDTTVGTPAASPTIDSVSVRSNGIELLQDGFFAECAIGITNEIKVTCSNATQLNAYATRLTMLPDEKVSVTKDGDVFTIKLDTTETPTDLSGDMLILTLAASNVDGTTVYENLMLRFSNVRRVVNGVYQVEDTAAMTEPLDFCGTNCEFDANGNTLSVATGMFTGTGSVILENTGSGGGFVFDTLNDFSGTLSLKDGVSVTLPADTAGYSGTLNTISGTVPILGNLPATATLNIATGATNVLNGVSVLASITGGGTVCVTNGTNRLGNSSTFGGNIVVSGTGTVLTMNAGEQRNVTVGAGTTLYLELSEELYNVGYMTTAASLVTTEEGGTVYFRYGNNQYEPVIKEGFLLFAPMANVWTATGTNDKYSATDHWSLGRLPAANEYAVLKIDDAEADYTAGFQRSIDLDLTENITLKGLKVASIAGGAGRLTINQSGDCTLTAQKFTNDTMVELNTTQILAETIEPSQRILLHSDKPVAYTIDYSYENYFRMVDDHTNYRAVTNSAAWHGTVLIAGYDAASPGLNPNDYGNENSVVRLKNVIGCLRSNVEYLPTIDLVDNGEYPALLWHNGSSSATTVFRKLTGSGVFRTRSPANGGGEKVLIKDVSGFTGSFDLEAKTVALGGDTMPTTDTSSNGRLHICGNVTNLAESVWRANDNVFIAEDATLTVKGVIDTQSVVAYGSNAAVNLLDGGEIRVLSGSAASDPSSFTQNFYAGTFTLKDSITQENAINFRAGYGKHTTVDVAGLTLTLGPDAMTGSGDIFFTSPGSAERGKVVIQGFDNYSGTISVDDNVDIEFPENASSSSCKLLIKDGQTVSVRAGNECNIIVEDGGTLNLVLTAEQILYGYDATSTVTVNAGGTVNFVNRSGETVNSASATSTIYEPEDGVTTGLGATAVWMTGDFDHPTNGYTLVLNSNVISNRNIFIESGATKGVTIDLSSANFQKASVIVRFRIPEGGAPSDNSALAGALVNGFPISALTQTAGGTAVEGAYLNKNDSYNLNVGSWNFTDGDAPSASAGHGYMLFAYQSDVYGDTTSHGTAVYLGSSLESLYGGNKAGLQWGSNKIATISIGGPVDDQAKTHVWAGLEIDGIAFFADQWLTAETAQDFAFPHTALDIQAGETLSVTAGNLRTYESVGTLSNTGTIWIDNAADLDVGTYVLARWREAKEPATYGNAVALNVDGLYEDYGAELVYDTTSISLRVFKAVYSATLSGGTSSFTNELFDPDLPSDYSRKTLEVNVSESSTLTVPAGGVTVKAIDFNVASGKTLTLSGGAVSAEVIGINGTIAGTLALGSGTVIKLPADVVSPVTLATTVTGTISDLMLGDSVYGGQWTLAGNVLTIKRYKAISINFGCNQNSGAASVGKRDWAGLASVTNWIDSAEYGVSGTYPTMGKAAITFIDSAGTRYPDMSLYLNSRGGNYYGKGDTSTVAGRILYGFIDDYSDSTVNAGVKVTGVNAFADKYSAYVYFNADANIDTTDYFPPYYVNGIMYRGTGSATVPGRTRWGTVKADSLADGVNVLVVHGLTDDTLVVAQPNNMGGRGCIAAIQIVEESTDDHTTDFVTPSGMDAVSVVPPSDDWSSRTLPTLAYATNVAGSIVSFGSTTPTEYYQLLGGRESIVALITGTDSTVYEAAGLQSENDTVTKNCGNRDLYLLITGGTFQNAIGIINQNYGGISNGSQSGGNAMVQIGGDATVQYAYGAGREGNGGTAPGSTGMTIKDAAVLTGSAFGGWSSQHQATPTVSGNTSVKVLNVQSVNSAATEFALVNDAIVGGSVFGANAASTCARINGSSSVVIDITGVSEATNFVKRLIGGCAGFNTYGGNHGGTFAVGGDSSVTVTAPNNVTFTGDITGGGFIQNNTGMYATVGGNSSVTINGGTFSGITITAGARGVGTDRATVAGDATLTINGGVFTGATLDAGTADGEKTLVLGSGASVAGSTVTGFTTIKLPAETSFPYTLATSVTLPEGAKLFIGGEQYDAEWTVSGGEITLGGLNRTAVYTSEASPAEWESLPWNVTIAEANMPSATNTVIVTGSGTIDLGSVTTAKVVFNVAEDEALTLSGTVTASEIYVTGLGSVVCSAADTLQGTISGDGTVVYNNVKPPTTLGWTNDVWTGTLKFVNHTATSEVKFDEYGNTNSIIKAPGFVGYSKMDTTARCMATLVIDDGTTFTFNNGNSGSGFRFAKLAGGGDLLLTGRTSATTQYVFEDVSAFTGNVTIDANASGDSYNRKSFVLGAPTDWQINATQCNAYTKKLVIAGNVTVPTGKSWSASEGVSVLGALGFDGSGVVTGPVATVSGATLDFSRSTAETPIDGTLTVASGTTIRVPEDATFPYNLASASAVVDESKLTLYIGDDEYADNWVLVDGKVHLGSLTRTATFSGGASAWSDLWSVDFTDETRFTNIINVTASGTFALGSVNTSKIVFNVAEGVQLILMSGTATANEIYVTGLGEVLCYAGNNVLQGAFTGDGTVVYYGALPPTNDSYGWTNATWSGTVWLMNITNESALRVGKWCSEGSKLKFTNVKGYLPGMGNNGAWFLDYDGRSLGELVLADDEANPAYIRSNGYSHSENNNSYCMFSKLSGSGTFTDASGQTVYVVFEDASDFTGSIYLTNNTAVIIGNESPSGTTDYNGKIVVESGKSATIATGKTWRATNSGLLVKGEMAFAGTGAFEGNVESVSDSTLDFSGSSSAQPVSGTLTIASGTTIKLPAGATFPYKLADAIAVDAASTVTLYVGLTSVSGTGLKVADGAICRDSAATFAGGESAIDWDDLSWSYTYFGGEATSDVTITATGIGTLNLGTRSGIGTMHFNVNEDVELTLNGTLSATEINVNGLGSVKCSADNTLQGTVKGSGTLAYETFLPKVGTGGITLSAESWAGTLWIRSIRGLVYSAGAGGNRVATNLTDLASYGNNASKVKFSDVQAYLPNANATYNTTLVLEDGSDEAWENDSGWTSNSNTILALAGGGTFLDGYNSCYSTMRFSSVAEFTGSIKTKGKRILIGSNAASDDTTTRGSISVGSDVTMTIAAGKTWETGGEFVINGSVTNNGTINIPTATATKNNNNGQTTNSTLTVSGTLTNAGAITIATNAVVTGTGTLAFSVAGTLTGDVVSESGATLDFSGSSSAKPVIGTLTIANGTTIKLPSTATFPYQLADVIVIDDPCSVTLRIGETEYLDTGLNVADGAIYRDRMAEFDGGTVAWDDLDWNINYDDATSDITVHATTNVTTSGTINLGDLSGISRIYFDVDENFELTLSGTLSATEIYVTGLGSVKCDAADTLTGTLKGDGTVVYTVKPNLGAGNLVATDEDWEGVVWIKGTSDKTVDIGGLVPTVCASSNSVIRLTGCTGYFNNNNGKQECAGTLDLQDDGEVKAFTITNGYSWDGISVFARLTGSGTFYQAADKDFFQRYVFVDVSEFYGAFEMYEGTRHSRIILGDGASLDPETSTVTVVGGATVKIATNKTWTASGVIVNGILEYGEEAGITGALTLNSGAVVNLPAGTKTFQLATSVTGDANATFKIGGVTYGGPYEIEAGLFRLIEYKAISINFGSNEASVGESEWIGLAMSTNWINTSAVGVNSNYPTGAVSLAIHDSMGTSYPSMQLYLCSGGNTWSSGGRSTSTEKMLYGYIDNHNYAPNNNAGVKLTGLNAFAERYTVYVYFNHDAAADSTSVFPYYYINGVGYCGNGSATVPGHATWGTIKKGMVADGVNALVVGGLADDTLIIDQPNDAGGRGCITAIQIVADAEGEPPAPVQAIEVVAPSGDWDALTLPTFAYTTNVAGSYVSFGSEEKTEYHQHLGLRDAIVSLVTGTDGTVSQAAGLQTSSETTAKYCGDRDLYLLVTGGTIDHAMGIINQSYGNRSNSGWQAGGNAMVQIGGDARVGYAYGAGAEGSLGSDGSMHPAPGSTGVTIKDAAVLTGSAIGGWSSYHQQNPTVNGNTSVKVLNVQTVNEANRAQTIANDAIVGGSVYGSNAGSTQATVKGSSSVTVDLMALSIPEETNFVKRLIGGCAGFGASNGSGGRYAISNDASVVVSAPDTVIFTGDITGGGFIENNTGMYATVGGNSSVTLNGGTYSNITITAGARGIGTDRATVAGTATLTINGGVFEGVTVNGGNASGTKTLVINDSVDLSDSPVSGFNVCDIAEDTTVYMLTGIDATITIPASSTLIFVVAEEHLALGFEPNIASGVVQYVKKVNGEFVSVDPSFIDGNNLLPLMWAPAEENGGGNLADGERWTSGSIPDDCAAVGIRVNGTNTLTVNATRTYGTINVFGSGTLLLEGDGTNHMTATNLIVAAGVTVKINNANNPLYIIDGDITGSGTLTIANGANLTLDGVTKLAGVSLTVPDGARLTIGGDGTTALHLGDRVIQGTLLVESDATLVSTTSDAIGYNSSARVEVYGTLTLNGRWTIGESGSNAMYFHTGAIINGDGDGSGVAIDLMGTQTRITVLPSDDDSVGTVECSAKIRLRNNAGIDIKDGMTFIVKTETALIYNGYGPYHYQKTGGGTLQFLDVNLAPVSGSEGALEFKTSTAHTYATNAMDFAGRFVVTRSGSTWPHFQGEPPLFNESALPDMDVSGGFVLTDNYNNNYLAVRNFSGSGEIATTFGGLYNDDHTSRTLKTVQAEDTVFSGQFTSSDNNYKRRNACLWVVGTNETVHALTLSGASTTYGELTVENYGKVVFTSSGSWANGTVTVGNNGYLESTNNAAISSLTLLGGSRLILVNAPLTVNGTLTLPTDALTRIDPGSIDMSGESAVLIAGVTPSETLADGALLTTIDVQGHPYAIVAAKANGAKIDIVAYNELPVESEGTEVSVPTSWAFTYAGSVIAANPPATVGDMETLLAAARGANGCTYLESYALGLTPTQEGSKPTADLAMASDGEHIEMFFKNLNVPEGVVLTVTAVKSVPGEADEVLSEASVTVTKDLPNRVRLPIPAGRVQRYRLKVSISGPAAD